MSDMQDLINTFRVSLKYLGKNFTYFIVIVDNSISLFFNHSLFTESFNTLYEKLEIGNCTSSFMSNN